MSAVFGGLAINKLRVAAGISRSKPNHLSTGLYCKCRSYSGDGKSNGNGGGDKWPQDTLLKALSEVSKTDARIARTLNVVIGGYLPDEQWKALDERVNLYPMVRRFTAIGKGGDDFAQAMVVAVETVLQSPIPRAWVTKKLSSSGKYISVRIGPVWVNSGDQVRAVYNAMRRDVRMKYFLINALGIAVMTGEVLMGNADRQQEVRIAAVDAKDGQEIEVITKEGTEVVIESNPEGRLILRWWKSRISDPFMVIIRRGTEPKQLAGSASLGVTLGVFPIYGVTVLLCGLAMIILRSKCHAPTLMLTNFVATPLELALLIPFLRLGEWTTNGGHVMLSSDALWKAITGHGSKDIWLSLLHALVGWLIASPFILTGFYIAFLPIFTCMVKRYGAKTDPELQVVLVDEEDGLQNM